MATPALEGCRIDQNTVLRTRQDFDSTDSTTGGCLQESEKGGFSCEPRILLRSDLIVYRCKSKSATRSRQTFISLLMILLHLVAVVVLIRSCDLVSAGDRRDVRPQVSNSVERLL